VWEGVAKASDTASDDLEHAAGGSGVGEGQGSILDKDEWVRTRPDSRDNFRHGAWIQDEE